MTPENSDGDPAGEQPRGERTRSHEQLVGELERERTHVFALLDSTDALIWAVDSELRLTTMNKRFRDAQTTVVGRALQLGERVLDPASDTSARWEQRYQRALDGEQFEVREVAAGRHVNLRFSPIRDATSQIVGAGVVGTDVTAEHVAMRSLAEREHLLRIAARLGRVAAWTIAGDTRRVTLSDELLEMFDIDAERTEGQLEVSLDEALRFYRPADRSTVNDDIERCFADGTPFDREFQIVRPGGDIAWVRNMAEAERDERGAITAVHGAIADITEHRTIQGRLREQTSLLDNATDAIVVQDLDGIVSYWNRAAEALYGWTAGEAVGRHIADLVDAGHRDKYAEVMAHIRSDGEWSGRTDNHDRERNRLVVELHVNTIGDEHGRPIAVFSIASDITERIQLEERLARAQKLEAVGQLTGGIAHDFNNLLTVISGSAELLSDAVVDDEPAGLVDMIAAAARRGADLTARLLASARRQPLRPEVLDPATVVDQVLALLRPSFPAAIGITVGNENDGENGGDAAYVRADPSQLEAAIMNVALNARDAMHGRGRLRFGIDTVVLASDPDLEVEPGEYVRIAIADDGPGMPPEVRARAFDPFFTTKQTGEGSGLGLSMVYGFVRQSGGHVELRSEPGLGTSVELLLPRVRPGATPGPAAPPRDDGLPRGTERILVVEDDPLVRSQTVTGLGRLGYDVVDAADGTEALALLERDSDAPGFDLVFSDVVMPGELNGFELAAEIEQRWPGTPVVLTSGYTEPHHEAGSGRNVLLSKPYRRAALAQTVRRVLDARPTP
ncbi:MAG: PAS domain S-box protein [Ilumatobacteraceae bacterium]